MRDFNLFLDVKGDWIPISNLSANNMFSSYDEKLNDTENNQYTLSFSIVKKYNDTSIVNPLLPYYFIGAKMRLILDGSKIIDFIIKDINPQTSNLNSVYQITAQDEISYLWARHNLGYSYSTINRETGILTPKNIFTIAEEVLLDNFIHDWTITSQSRDADLFGLVFVLETSNSNPYNTIIEACNTVEAYLLVDYRTKQLDFIRKKMVGFSGYQYNPERTLVSYNASYSGEELTTILHVSGGTDENDTQVTMIPAMPEALKRYIYEKTDKISNWDSFLNNLNWSTIRSEITPNVYTPSHYDIINTTEQMYNGPETYFASSKKAASKATTFRYTADGEGTPLTGTFDCPAGKWDVTFVPNAQTRAIEDPVITLGTAILSQGVDIPEIGKIQISIKFANYIRVQSSYEITAEGAEKQNLAVIDEYGDFDYSCGSIYTDKPSEDYNIEQGVYISANNVIISLPDSKYSSIELASQDYLIYAPIINKYQATYVSKSIQDSEWVDGILEPGYYSETSLGFLSIKEFNINEDGTTKNISPFISNIKYDNVSSNYYLLITEQITTEQTTEESPREFKILINLNDYNKPFGVDFKLDETTITHAGVPIVGEEQITAIIIQSREEMDKAKADFDKKQTRELDQFFAVAERIPNLSQSLIDFSPFRHCMSQMQWNALDSLLNIELRNYNIKLQYYASEYYYTLYEIERLRSLFETYGTLYMAAVQDYKKVLESNANAGTDVNEDKIESARKNATQAKDILCSVIDKSNYKKLLEAFGADNDLEIAFDSESKQIIDKFFLNRISEKEELIKTYEQELIGITASFGDGDSYDTKNLDSQRECYYNLRETAMTYCYPVVLPNGEQFEGIYTLINSVIEDQNAVIHPSGISSNFKSIQNYINNVIMGNLYRGYGQYIYEQNFENSSELDPVSLFNQALLYFADINKIQSSYSLEVLDIGELECINIPRLSVGSLIRVQNKDSVNAIPYLDIVSKIEDAINLYNYYVINKSENVEIQLGIIEELQESLVSQYKTNNGIEEEDISYQEVIYKIFNDEILVTGISRVLREPLKDTVTVEQSSRYKTILSKLIKLI